MRVDEVVVVAPAMDTPDVSIVHLRSKDRGLNIEASVDDVFLALTAAGPHQHG